MRSPDIESNTIEVEGEVVEFQYKNPHCWIHVMAQETFGGRKDLHATEWASVSRLEREGITAKTLRPGDVVRIWASPNRNPNDNRIRLKRIERQIRSLEVGRSEPRRKPRQPGQPRRRTTSQIARLDGVGV